MVAWNATFQIKRNQSEYSKQDCKSFQNDHQQFGGGFFCTRLQHAMAKE